MTHAMAMPRPCYAMACLSVAIIIPLPWPRRYDGAIDRYVATVPGAQEVSEAWRLILLDPVEHLRHLQDYVTYQVQ